MKGKKVMITGGFGMMGSTIAHKLVEKGANVLLVDSRLPEYGSNMANIEEII